MFDLSHLLADHENIELAVATPVLTSNFHEVKKDVVNKITFYTLPFVERRHYPKSLEKLWPSVCSDFRPDIIHIHGTEFPRGISCMRAVPHMKYVVSLQGVMSILLRHLRGGLSNAEILKNLSIGDIIFKRTIYSQIKDFKFRATFEPEYLKKSDVVLGRNDWCLAHAKAIDNKCRYEYGGEMLRHQFYEADAWDISKVERYTLFVSQGHYQLKGLHQLIKAVHLLIEEFPSIKIQVAGSDIIHLQGYKQKLLSRNVLFKKILGNKCVSHVIEFLTIRSGYSYYLQRLLDKYNLSNNIEFLGMLDGDAMVHQYQKSHIYICASSIENSPNSLCEAQMIGTPSVSSYVGGVPDMIENGKTGYTYRFEEYEMLAQYIRRILLDDQLASRLSSNERAEAFKRHDREFIVDKLINVYKSIL